MECYSDSTAEAYAVGENSKNPSDQKEPSVENGDLTISKNQRKKLMKAERWLSRKAEVKLRDKEKRKAKKARLREMIETGMEVPRKRKTTLMSESKCGVNVVIDCSFDKLMVEKDIFKMVHQLQWCYSANRKTTNPVQLHICTVEGEQTQKRLDSLGDYAGWDVHHHRRPYTEVFAAASVVYLSSESPNALQELEEDKYYVIGGLVDHNHHKGLCLELAEKAGMAHAQLPIAQHVEMTARRTLAINHVFEILLRMTETNDWEKAFHAVIPKRKVMDVSNKKQLTEESHDARAEGTGGESHDIQGDRFTAGSAVERNRSDSLQSEEVLEEGNSAATDENLVGQSKVLLDSCHVVKVLDVGTS